MKDTQALEKLYQKAFLVPPAQHLITDLIKFSECFCVVGTHLKIIGFIAVNDYYVQLLMVDPNYQNQGVGTNLIEYIKQQKTFLSLNVPIQSFPAVNFYFRRGFSIVDIQDNSYLMAL